MFLVLSVDNAASMENHTCNAPARSWPTSTLKLLGKQGTGNRGTGNREAEKIGLLPSPYSYPIAENQVGSATKATNRPPCPI